MSPRYARRPVLDVLTADGEALVLLADSRVARLSPIGAACYELLTQPATVTELAAELERRFGPPPGTTSGAAVAAVLKELVTAGLLDQLDGAPE